MTPHIPDSQSNDLILVLGGARSGKSSWALSHAEERFETCLFLATAEVLDKEMEERVELHRQARGPKWRLLEEPLELPAALEKRCGDAGVVLVDCLTLWLSNVLLQRGAEQVPIYEERLVKALSERRMPVILVANEVGTGIVPEHALGRKFRDLAGFLNQRMAQLADKVVFLVAGLPMVLKGDLETDKNC